jgi:stress response protein YsnF
MARKWTSRKRTRVTGEVDVDKEAVQSTQRVKDTVRREEVTVEGDVVEGSQSTGSRSDRNKD